MTVKSQEGIEGDTRTVRTVSEGQNGQKSIGRGRLSKTYAYTYMQVWKRPWVEVECSNVTVTSQVGSLWGYCMDLWEVL